MIMRFIELFLIFCILVLSVSVILSALLIFSLHASIKCAHACVCVWVKQMSPHAFNHVEVCYSLDAKAAYHHWLVRSFIALWSHVAVGHPADSHSVTPISSSRPPSGPCPPAPSLWQWELSWRQSCRDDPHPAPQSWGLFRSLLILGGLPFMGRLCQLLPHIRP